MNSVRRVLVTGAGGFIGKNLVLRLKEYARFEVENFGRGHAVNSLPTVISNVDCIVHLAGENRPKNEEDFLRGNTQLTQAICDAIESSGRNIPLILTSSTQAEIDNPYGRSKLRSEHAVKELAKKTGNSVVIYRLPGVFGKWCKPNYNSVVATFCHHIARDQPIQINNASHNVRLVYVDDVVNELISVLEKDAISGICVKDVEPQYDITLGNLAEQIRAFKNCRDDLVSEKVGSGLTRALYATYVSYLPTDQFSYKLPCHSDARGMFVEMLKTQDSGQFSFFTAHPGVTRGSHYHHTKTEKFLVIRGKARLRFRHLITDETCELYVSGDEPRVVDSIPGWVHDITNVGAEDIIVMLWANEVFDRNQPDTIACKV